MTVLAFAAVLVSYLVVLAAYRHFRDEIDAVVEPKGRHHQQISWPRPFLRSGNHVAFTDPTPTEELA